MQLTDQPASVGQNYFVSSNVNHTQFLASELRCFCLGFINRNVFNLFYVSQCAFWLKAHFYWNYRAINSRTNLFFSRISAQKLSVFAFLSLNQHLQTDYFVKCDIYWTTHIFIACTRRRLASEGSHKFVMIMNDWHPAEIGVGQRPWQVSSQNNENQLIYIYDNYLRRKKVNGIVCELRPSHTSRK